MVETYFFFLKFGGCVCKSAVLSVEDVDRIVVLCDFVQDAAVLET